MKKILQLYILLIFLGFVTYSNAQNVGINSTNATPDASAMLDVSSANTGLLIPRVALTGTVDVTTITTAATSLLVYNTATITDITPGYYYWNGSIWLRMINTGNASGGDWSITGNTGTDTTINFIGTTDNMGVKIKTNDTTRIFATPSGNVGIGTLSPSSRLSIDQGQVSLFNEFNYNNHSVGFPSFNIYHYSNGTVTHPHYSFLTADGTRNTPTAVQATNNMGEMIWWGFGDTQFNQLARTGVFASQNITDTKQLSHYTIRFDSTTNDWTNPYEVFKTTSRGKTRIGPSFTPSTSPYYTLDVNGGSYFNSTGGQFGHVRVLSSPSNLGQGGLIFTQMAPPSNGYGFKFHTEGTGIGNSPYLHLGFTQSLLSPDNVASYIHIDSLGKMSLADPILYGGANVINIYQSADGQSGINMLGAIDWGSVYGWGSGIMISATVQATTNQTLYIDGGNRVGINTTAQTTSLSVNGGVNKPGGGAWAVFSDKTLKKDINDFTLGLETLSKLHLVNFKYNDKYFDLFGESETVRKATYQGVIAQELQKIAPFMVSNKTADIYNEKGEIIKQETVLEVDPSAFTYMLINSVQELKQENEVLKKENELLLKDIKLIKEKLGIE